MTPLDRARIWLEADIDPTTQAELKALLEQNATAEIEERFAGPLEFGTAGLRGLLGAGESRMNRAVVLRTSHGLGKHLLSCNSVASVVVGYDGRRQSDVFAEDTACALAALGIRVHLFPRLCPTPLLAFAVLELGADAGVMITASHNPPEYNGYKVYASNGAQITPPLDRQIAEAIALAPPANRVPRLDLAEARRQGLVIDVPNELAERYLSGVQRMSQTHTGDRSFPIVYTPLHGTGGAWTPRALLQLGFNNVHIVREQAEPDGSFPTVRFPNPEEPGALDLAFRDARAHGAALVLANDPDADRLAVAVPTDGGFRQLTGNEVGVLLGEYLLRQTQGLDKRLMIASLVSSPMLGVICAKHGVFYEETLTGFKWIATRAIAREAAGERFVFGYEEALGYTLFGLVRDKDGVSAAALFAELVAVARSEGRSVLDELERLARTYGLFVSAQHNIAFEGQAGKRAMNELMERLRSCNDIASIEFAGLRVVGLRDVARGVEQRAGRTRPLELPKSNVLVFDLEENARVIVRPSGTEPKIKFYFDASERIAPDEPYVCAEVRAKQKLGRLRDAFLAFAGLSA